MWASQQVFDVELLGDSGHCGEGGRAHQAQPLVHVHKVFCSE